jgi:hypothetical protein
MLVVSLGCHTPLDADYLSSELPWLHTPLAPYSLAGTRVLSACGIPQKGGSCALPGAAAWRALGTVCVFQKQGLESGQSVGTGLGINK